MVAFDHFGITSHICSWDHGTKELARVTKGAANTMTSMETEATLTQSALTSPVLFNTAQNNELPSDLSLQFHSN